MVSSRDTTESSASSYEETFIESKESDITNSEAIENEESSLSEDPGESREEPCSSQEDSTEDYSKPPQKEESGFEESAIEESTPLEESKEEIIITDTSEESSSIAESSDLGEESQPVEESEPEYSQTLVSNEPEVFEEISSESEPFDINHWIEYAKSYAESVGLVLDASAVDCWDNPIGADAECIYLERDIQSRLNRYSRDEDITWVWIWAEEVRDNYYNLYIGYA